ncbi:BRCA1-associated protein-like [Mya arenaria]|uniref:BRCA1-associated protein-like n=1 Tax=Mya arenaria TaxID=6604 RepID=UPI0022E11196|nr:BRCA1-associated protein-like [Mya arenaria]
MKVALLNIRFEISDQSNIINYLEFKARGFNATAKASYAKVLSEQQTFPAKLDSDYLEELRGSRKISEIQIETYLSKDYDLEAIEEFVSDSSMSESLYVRAGSEGRGVGIKNAGSDGSGFGLKKAGSDGSGVDVKKAGLDGSGVDVKKAGLDGSGVDVKKAGLDGSGVNLKKARSDGSGVDVKKAGLDGSEVGLKNAGLDGSGVDVKNDQTTSVKKSLEDKEVSTTVKNGKVGSMEGDTGVRPKSQSPTPKGMASLHFYSGNPGVEKLKGILHIYKDNHMTSLSEDTARSELICMLAVPAKYTIHDLLKFNAPFLKGIEYMRIIRDGAPNQYMVLVKFRDQSLADEYYSTYNNVTFNSIEADICHLVYVGQVEMLKESENACMPIPGMTELPNCPVCLERMDESVDGILTILCNHAFHMHCLSQWFDTSCPVCRYSQTPEEVDENRCMKCGSQESLWICLICGNIGCGRYIGLHAYRHFQETQHTYAMELGNNKVWDYIGDNYVHRLVQNKSDGKLVQVDEGGNPVQDEKIDALNLEYTYLLTNQLDSQRLYFEEKMGDVESAMFEKVHLLEEENMSLAEQCSKLHMNLECAIKDKHMSEKKCTQLQTRLKKVFHDLQEEREINKSLQRNQDEWKQRVTTLECEMKKFTDAKDKEISELREQLRDVMFYVEAQGKLQHAEGVSQEEISESHVILGGATGGAQQGAKQGRRKKQR